MMSSSKVSLSTGSFQNQAATVDALETASVPKTDGVKRRKRDMSVLLEQASSSEGVYSSGKGTRSCSAKANDKLRALFVSRKSPESKVTCTTSSVLKEDRPVFDRGMDSLVMYIERNATWELQKAFAILVMGTALVDWNEGVCEAAQEASNVTHFSEHTIRNWMQLYIQSTSDLLSDGKDTITDQDIEESLASEKGHFDRLDSLISDEDFQLSASTYVRSNACKKGRTKSHKWYVCSLGKTKV